MKEIMAHLTTLVDTYYIYGNTKLDNLLKWSNNCYNEANYLFRQRHFKNIRQYKYDLHLYKVGKLKEKPKYGKDYTATELTRLLKKQSLEGQNTLYRDCINIKISNSVVKDVKRNWSNYYKSLSDYKKYPYKYLGKPKFPKYLRKGKRHSTELDTQTIKLKGNYLVYDKADLKVRISPYLQQALDDSQTSNDEWLDQLARRQRIRTYWLKPIIGGVKLCVTYVVSQEKLTKYKGKDVPQRKAGIVVAGDPGVDNLMTLATNNWQVNPLIINGKGIKSVNHFYNKRKAKLQELATKYKQKGVAVHKKDGTTQVVYHTGRAYSRLTQWRNQKILSAIHKATDRIIAYAISCGAERIIIGRNKYWKQRSNIGKKNNQNFAGIPHYRVVQILTYKANRYGIEVVTQPESYTSQTSFLDNEKPCWSNGNSSRKKQGKSPINRRIKRGLFRSNEGYLINADVNGALQIITKNKVFCDRSNSQQIIGCVLHPRKWSPHF